MCRGTNCLTNRIFAPPRSAIHDQKPGSVWMPGFLTHPPFFLPSFALYPLRGSQFHGIQSVDCPKRFARRKVSRFAYIISWHSTMILWINNVYYKLFVFVIKNNLSFLRKFWTEFRIRMNVTSYWIISVFLILLIANFRMNKKLFKLNNY